MSATLSEGEILAVYRATIDDLYAHVSRRCDGDRELAEDITQETWLRAVREWHRGGLPRRPIAWLTTVANNLLANQFRRKVPLPLDEVSPDAMLLALDYGSGESPREVRSGKWEVRSEK